eukprot:jgi/Chlat1/7103/Chrsp57S06792
MEAAAMATAVPLPAVAASSCVALFPTSLRRPAASTSPLSSCRLAVRPRRTRVPVCSASSSSTVEPTDPNKRGRGAGLAREGPGQGGQWLSATTRHVRIYIGEVIDNALDQSVLDKVTIDVDPDNEFTWDDVTLRKVYDRYEELVQQYAGAPMTDYTLRLISSDIEHFIRQLLMANEIGYNLNARVLNFSMGKPRVTGVTKEES